MKNTLPKVGYKVEIIDIGIDGSYCGIPLVIVDESITFFIKNNFGAK